jgi:UPF0716 protein FxsA
MELYFMGMIAKRIGFLHTLIIVLGTGIIGAFIARKNAKIALTNLVKGDFKSGNPGQQIFNAITFFIAAALLIIPGIITDAAGILLLFPFIRSALYSHFATRTNTSGTTSDSTFNPGYREDRNHTNRNTLSADEVIDIEAEDIS